MGELALLPIAALSIFNPVLAHLCLVFRLVNLNWFLHNKLLLFDTHWHLNANLKHLVWELCLNGGLTLVENTLIDDVLIILGMIGKWPLLLVHWLSFLLLNIHLRSLSLGCYILERYSLVLHLLLVLVWEIELVLAHVLVGFIV